MDENVTETTMEEIVGEMTAETSSGPSGHLPQRGRLLGNGETERTEPQALPSGEREASSPPVAEERGGFTPKVAERSEAGEVPPAGDAPAQEEGGGRRAELTRGITALAADGWTSEELRAFSQDAQAVRDIAEGKSLENAALRYMRRARAAGSEGRAAPTPAKRSVPTSRAAGAGETDAGDPIARMSDKEFDAFYARAMEKAMTGARVRI